MATTYSLRDYHRRYEHLRLPGPGPKQHAQLIQLELDKAAIDAAWADRLEAAGEHQMAAELRGVVRRRHEEAKTQRGALRAGSR